MHTPLLELDINGRFARVNLNAISDKRVSNAALRVLAALGAFAGKGNRCWVGTRRIAAETGVNQADVVRHIQKLRELRYVMVSPHQPVMGSPHHVDGVTTSRVMGSSHKTDGISPRKAMVSSHRNYRRELESELERARAREPDQGFENGNWKKAETAIARQHLLNHGPGCQCTTCDLCPCDECEAKREARREHQRQKLQQPEATPNRP